MSSDSKVSSGSSDMFSNRSVHINPDETVEEVCRTESMKRGAPVRCLYLNGGTVEPTMFGRNIEPTDDTRKESLFFGQNADGQRVSPGLSASLQESSGAEQPEQAVQMQKAEHKHLGAEVAQPTQGRSISSVRQFDFLSHVLEVRNQAIENLLWANSNFRALTTTGSAPVVGDARGAEETLQLLVAQNQEILERIRDVQSQQQNQPNQQNLLEDALDVRSIYFLANGYSTGARNTNRHDILRKFMLAIFSVFFVCMFVVIVPSWQVFTTSCRHDWGEGVKYILMTLVFLGIGLTTAMFVRSAPLTEYNLHIALCITLVTKVVLMTGGEIGGRYIFS